MSTNSRSVLPFACALALALAASAAGCSSPEGSTGVGNPLSVQEQALVDDGADGLDAGSVSSAVVALPLLAIQKQTELASADVAAGTATASVAAFFPQSCRTASRSGNVVTYTLTACTVGPLGLATLSGTLTATFTAGASGSVDVAIQSGSDLALDGVPVTESATANVAIAASGARTITWKGGYTSKTPRGRAIQHDAQYVVQTDGNGCIDLDGTATSSVGGRALRTDTAGYKRCGGKAQCPSAGELTFTDTQLGLSLKLDFLGGTSAVVVRPNGDRVEIALRCTP
jgi:hypothetical protein